MSLLDPLPKDLFALAAAYLFHIVSNYPFIDANKRTDLIAALTFLAINGHPIDKSSPLLYDATMAVAEGRLDKVGIAEHFRSLVTS